MYEFNMGASFGYSPLTIKVLSVYSLTLSVLFLLALTAKVSTPIQAQGSTDLAPLATLAPVPTIEPTPTPTPEPTLPPDKLTQHLQEKETIRRYIQTIFRQNASTAFAVALAESGKTDIKTGERYFEVDAINRSSVEVSVGLFQINLKSAEALVHWDRVPGKTEAEKIEWLQDPLNNTLCAFWIYSHSGFWPWSVFSDGKYLAYVR